MLNESFLLTEIRGLFTAPLIRVLRFQENRNRKPNRNRPCGTKTEPEPPFSHFYYPEPEPEPRFRVIFGTAVLYP